METIKKRMHYSEIHATNNEGAISIHTKGDEIDKLITIAVLLVHLEKQSKMPFELQIHTIKRIYNDLEKAGALKQIKECYEN